MKKAGGGVGGGELHVTHTHLSRWRTVSPILENAAARRVSGKPVQQKLRNYFKGSVKYFTVSVIVTIDASVNQCHCNSLSNTLFLPKTCYSLDSNLKPSTNRPPLLHIPTHCTSTKFLDATASGKLYRSKYRKAVYILFLPSGP